MSRAKSDGGMGFRDFRAMNVALLARQGWRMLKNPDSFWAKMMKGLYFPNSSFLEATKGYRASWAWLSILSGREILMKGLRWQVQNGESIRFWEDTWIPNVRNFTLSSPRPDDTEIEWVADVIDKDRRCWKEEKLSQVLLEEEVKAIVSIPISFVPKGGCQDFGITRQTEFTQ